MRVIFGSDFHIGLKTDDINRNEEIVDVMKDIVEHAMDVKEAGEEVKIVFGGDIFNSNNPSEDYIALLISVFNAIREYDIETYIMAGNHDEVADPARVSCLNFIRELGEAYPMITLIDDIKFMHVGTFDTGPLYFTFLPHVSKALIQRKVNKKEIRNVVSTQDYIDSKAASILAKVGQGSQHIAFSHLNVRGAHGGSEENLLKKSTCYLPDCFINVPIGYVEPEIIQAHVHSRQKIGNINIVGSQIFCGFGENEKEKYFLDLKIGTELGSNHELNYIKTNCVMFKELEVDMFSDNTPFMERDDVLDFLDVVDENTVIKFDITTNMEGNLTDWKGITDEIYKDYKPYLIKKIRPRLVLDRRVKNSKQKIGIDPKKSVQIYLKKHLKSDKERLIRIYKRSLKYI